MRREARRRQIRRRRLTTVAVAFLVVLGGTLALAWAGRGGDGPAAAFPAVDAEPDDASAASKAGRRTKPSDRTMLVLRETLGGEFSPKSVASSGTGLVFAQNMMYRHSVTVYDSRTLELAKTISDTVRLAEFGYERFQGTSQGAPVEAAFSPDGRYAYLSNYSMYGEGFGPEGVDSCTPASGYDRSFVYRISLETLEIDDAYRVGAVPKVVA